MKRTSLGIALLAATTMGIASAGAYDNTQTSSSHTGQSIVDVAEHAGQFSTLVKALETTGLDKTLAGQGPFTVFAPTDAAFEKLPKAQLNKLMNNEEALTKVLTYHVVSGEVPASKVRGMDSTDTVEGSKLDIHTQGTTVMIEDARIVNADIKASNGVIHVIDHVLMPPNTKI